MVICSPGFTWSSEEFTELLLQVLFKHQADALQTSGNTVFGRQTCWCTLLVHLLVFVQNIHTECFLTCFPSLTSFTRHLFFWNTRNYLNFLISLYLAFYLHPTGLEISFFFFFLMIKKFKQTNKLKFRHRCNRNKRYECTLHKWFHKYLWSDARTVLWVRSKINLAEYTGLGNKWLGKSKRRDENTAVCSSIHFSSTKWLVVPDSTVCLLVFNSLQ